jgi:predicted DNA-binding transcriptional regulator
MTDLAETEDAMARTVGRYASVNARILAALLSVLIRNGVISPETIEKEFLDYIQNAFEPLVLEPDQEIDGATDHDVDQSLSARAMLAQIHEIRAILFPDAG